MPDREKVIKALEYCVSSDDCRTCEYWMTFDDTGCQIMKDALTLLKEQEDLGIELTNAVELIHEKNERIEKLLKVKEQEAVEPVKTPWLHSDGSMSEKYRCGSCDLSIFPSYKFCPFCGRSVKWSED